MVVWCVARTAARARGGELATVSLTTGKELGRVEQLAFRRVVALIEEPSAHNGFRAGSPLARKGLGRQVAGVLSSQTVRAMNEIHDAHLASSAPDMHPEDRGWDGVSLHESVLKRIHVAAGVT